MTKCFDCRMHFSEWLGSEVACLCPTKSESRDLGVQGTLRKVSCRGYKIYVAFKF